MTLLFSSSPSAICSSPAAHMNLQGSDWDVQMVHNSGPPKYIMYTTDPLHLGIITVVWYECGAVCECR